VSIANGRDAPTLGAKGGGILNAGSLLIGQSVVRHSAAVALDGGNGGGIHNTGTLELVDSAVRDNSAGSESLATGGGIYNTGTLVLTHSTVHNNAVPVGPGTFSAGGGIESVGDLTLSGSTVRDNSGDSGGGIATNGTASILDSTVRDNSARNGGGIVNTGTLVLSGSTVSGNSVTNNLGGIGGGLVNTGSVSLVNSTISNNEVRGVLSATGGGISNSGTLTSTNSTIAGNAVKVDTPEGPSGVGGLFTNGGSATLENTIVAKSHGADCGPSGAVTSLGHNLDSDGTCGLSSAGDLSGADPLLGPLANNGGPTETHALKDGSPAIDAGDNVGCPATDQRGTARPQGAACDIGAFERADAAASADLVLVKAASANEVTVGDVLVYTLTVTNSGPAATSVLLTDPLPDRVTLLETRPSQGSCRIGPPERTTVVMCSLGELSPEATATVTIVVRPTRPGEIVNTASATSSVADPNLRNNRARIRTRVLRAR